MRYAQTFARSPGLPEEGKKTGDLSMWWDWGARAGGFSGLKNIAMNA